MQEWLKLSLLISVFGFLKNIRPSEPFVYEFLIDKRWRNLTDEMVTQEVYPIATYSNLLHLVFVFLITDFLKYKPFIVLMGASGIVIYSLLLWTSSLLWVQIVEVLYGTFCACEVAYYTYIYAKVDKEYYQQVTSHTRAANLAGSAISGVLGQLLISLKAMNFRDLNYITLSAMIAATSWSLFLPKVEKTIYFHQTENDRTPLIKKFNKAFGLMGTHICNSFTNAYVLKWSLWYALSTCGFMQVQSYMQPLWFEITGEGDRRIFNGAVEAVLTVLGFLGALLAGVTVADWEVKGELFLTICSLLQGFIILFASRTPYIVVCYICYIAFGSLFHFMITVASSEISKCVKDDSFGLVFGVNTFLALAVQTLLTALVVTDGVGFALAPREQYFVYGCFHIVIAVVYIVIGLGNWMAKSPRGSSMTT